MSRWKKAIFTGIALVSLLTLTACGKAASSNSSHTSSKSESIIIGSSGSDYQIWQHIAKSPQAKKAGLRIKVKQVSDGNVTNSATAEGQLDVNAFQSYAYFQQYNKLNPSEKLAALGTTYLEPMGLYSKKYKQLREIPDGATIGISNDPANATRGLLLLATTKLVTLKSDFNALSTVKDIQANPKHLKFKEVDPSVQMLPDLDAELISNTRALDGGLNVLKDSLVHEKLSQTTRANVNILVTAVKNEKKEEFKKLVPLYHDPTIQSWIKKTFSGTKLDVNKPISYLQQK
ncbi:MetQ/NlpA family ABC transporter substrate-binding protein [Lacticaseibacillus paracasei]|uniref:MetQ/NlpA family ABC transporter substrate-binding protein n=1 Tax=Lacticaseibacillus paracasei TaxID=1597 RepID=UPI0030D4F7F4